MTYLHQPRSANCFAALFLLLTVLGITLVPATQADRIVLLDDPMEAFRARVQLIEGAEKTMEIEYYAIHDGIAARSLIGLLREAADRGVKIRILLDAVTNGLRGKHDGALGYLMGHENIELRLYNAFRIFRPSRWNHRLHDKIFLVDDQFLIMGGRNIGDKYFGMTDLKDLQSFDRDACVLREDGVAGVIPQVGDYFEAIWQSQRSFVPSLGTSSPGAFSPVRSVRPHGDNKLVQAVRTRHAEQLIRAHLVDQRRVHPERFEPLPLWSRSLPVEHIQFAHNEMLTKDRPSPAADAIAEALLNARETVLIQSPYVIPDKDMKEFFTVLGRQGVAVTILTNSKASSPNIMALSGYEYYKPRLIHSGVNFYEYQGPHSLHAKSFVMDGHLSMVGSFNLDPRSIDLNTETIFLVESKPFAEALTKAIRSYQARAIPVGPDGRYLEGEGPRPEEVSGFKKGMLAVLKPFVPWYRWML